MGAEDDQVGIFFRGQFDNARFRITTLDQRLHRKAVQAQKSRSLLDSLSRLLFRFVPQVLKLAMFAMHLLADLDRRGLKHVENDYLDLFGRIQGK